MFVFVFVWVDGRPEWRTRIVTTARRRRGHRRGARGQDARGARRADATSATPAGQQANPPRLQESKDAAATRRKRARALLGRRNAAIAAETARRRPTGARERSD